MEFDPKNFKPLNGMILVMDDEKKARSGSIYIPETAEGERMLQGTVLGVSPFMLQDGKYSDPEMDYGDIVMYSFHAGAGATFESNKRTYRVIRHNEILGVIFPPAKK